MDDRLTTALTELDRVAVPLSWADVEGRAPLAEAGDLPTSSPAPGSGRRAVLLVAAVLVVLAGLVVIPRLGDDTAERVHSVPASTASTTAPTTTTPATTAPPYTTTTLGAIGTFRGEAVEVWTTKLYLVWGGQAGGDGYVRGDGWTFDPLTGVDTPIPVAPIGPRDSAAGAWTGTELVVCCGNSTGEGPGYETANAAAFDPETGTWRVLAPPPPSAAGYALGAVWTGTEVLVVVKADLGPEMTLLAYDPATDTWDQRATPPVTDRIGTVLWTGSELVLWTVGYAEAPHHDQGARYDPRTDTWQELPDLPADHRPAYSSPVWLGDELLVWGTDESDRSRMVGYRWKPGTQRWRRIADAPLDPVEPYEGTEGSQTLAYDERTHLVVGLSQDPGDGTPYRFQVTYNPEADGWERPDPTGQLTALGYDRTALIGHGRVLRPDVEDPVAFIGPG